MGAMRAAAGGLVFAFLLSACGAGAAPSAAPAAASAASAPTVKIVDNAKLGKILVAANGMTLYIFDKDSPNKSTCTGSCAAKWPAFTISSGQPVAPAGLTGKLGVIASASGGQQVTHDGSPLYLYAADTKAGDTNGDGVGGIWHAVKNP